MAFCWAEEPPLIALGLAFALRFFAQEEHSRVRFSRTLCSLVQSGNALQIRSSFSEWPQVHLYISCVHILALTVEVGVGSFELCQVVRNGGGNLDSDSTGAVLVGNFV